MIMNGIDVLHYVIAFLCISCGFHVYSSKRITENHSQIFACFLAVFMALIMGFYDIPISSDREAYANGYFSKADISWSDTLWQGEWVFASYMKLLSPLDNVQLWFIITALIYTLNYWAAAKRLAPRNCYLLYISMAASFCFASYGFNTIRAGLALSLVTLAITYHKNFWTSAFLFFLAFNIHHSTGIPIGAFYIAKYYDRPKFFYYFWFLCVFLSAVAGGFFQTLFASLGEDSESRISYLTTTETYYNIGFRIDFLLYGCLPIIMGYIYQNKLHYQNKFYTYLHSTYTISNAFWVLVIRANFSDRFAYLSWFLYAIVMLYPFLENPRHFANCNQRMGLIIIGIAVFKFIMY